MSYQLQPKPLQLFYYLPYIHQLAIPMVPQYPICNFPQQVSPIYQPVVPGTSQDNCIVIEDDNIQHPLNQIHSMILQSQTNREQNSLQDDVMQQEQPVQNITHQNNNLNENQPHIRITVFKQHSSQTDQEFILQNDRILGSDQKKEIIIGRKKQQEEKQDTCDIYLPHGDKNVEKVHCKILTDQGFVFSNTLTKPLILFFSLIRNNQHASKLPFSVIKHIYSFIKNKPQFYICDNGTRAGTFMKIKKDKIRTIEQENTYLIGADTFFHVLEKKSQPKQNKSKKVKKDQSFFYNALAKEHIRRGSKIHGLTLEETEMFNVAMNEIKTTKQKQRTSQKLSEYDRPYLKITFDNQAIHQIITHIFVANYNQESVYKIGRSQECDVLVNINTVSRKQAQIIYKNNEWFIHDGEGVRESANGTWQSLQNFSQRNHDKKLQSSRPQLIEDQMEIKISENIVKFDFVNCGITKKRKLNKALIQDLLNIQ
ncbi:unnamed protein product (macronuclear) [Paramecium tetraurelia]|uniref:FHA domain-containing protein n=1 Tax=Paramecium tetraurelia TaxID=5888 RepID=A0DGC7_PARTE|nr:uncharacterized protein GSPATT00002223001 [Paramecium tetraurelia]CAK82094.1 unnamed protein product [Paramecium tetraurelia]|eukprot:XP_001449491.1 hypothetical protein (macronuclear) [Paramecium tetraurelia strain d4-2]